MMNSTKMMKKKVTFAEKVKSRKQVDDEDLSDMPPQEGNEEEVKERKD